MRRTQLVRRKGSGQKSDLLTTAPDYISIRLKPSLSVAAPGNRRTDVGTFLHIFTFQYVHMHTLHTSINVYLHFKLLTYLTGMLHST